MNQPDPQPSPARDRGELPWRGFLVGAALCVVLNALAVRSYALVNRYSGFADHFNTVGVIFLFFCVAALAALVHWLLGLRLLRQTDLVAAYGMLMVGTAIPTMGLGGYLFPLTTGVFYYASPENRWAEFLHPNVPRWLAPQDESVIRTLYEGLPKGEPIPWAAWVIPLAFWTLFVLALYLASVGVVSLLRRRWVEEERLVYPLAVVPLRLVEAGGGRGGFFRSRLMWAGFFFAFLLLTYNYAASRLGAGWLPLQLGTRVRFERSGVDVLFTFDTLVLGLSYLLNLEVAFSVWVFHLLTLVEKGVFNRIGFRLLGPPEPHAAGGSALANQQAGSMLFLALAALWMARRSIRDLLRRDASRAEEAKGLASSRTALACLVLGVAGMAAFLRATGIPWAMVALLLALALGLMFGVTRLLAQAGVGRMRAPASAPALMTNLVGTAPLGDRGLGGLGTSFVWAGDIQLFVMGTLAQVVKVASEARRRTRGLFWILGAALVISLVACYGSYLYFGYRGGMANGYVWYFVSSPQYHWGWIADCIMYGREPHWGRTLFLGIGAGATAALSWAHLRFPGWPLHPIGLAISMTNTVWIDWFSIFLAWLCKTLVLRYGGPTAYRRSRLLFLGLIVGSCVARGTTTVLDALFPH